MTRPFRYGEPVEVVYGRFRGAVGKHKAYWGGMRMSEVEFDPELDGVFLAYIPNDNLRSVEREEEDAKADHMH